jgi:cobalt-zinc-cadmium efflux system protein
MAADAAVSLGVVATGLVIGATGWLWLDPVASMVIALVILGATWSLLRQSLRLAVQAVPSGVDAGAVRHYLLSQPGVVDAHDLHIWAMSTTENAMTAHLVMPQGHPGDPFLQRIADELDTRFDVGHSTLQVETDSSDRACRLAPADEI